MKTGSDAEGSTRIRRSSPIRIALRLLLPLWLCSAMHATTFADSLLVMTNANAVWVSSTRTDGDNLRYTVGTNAEERTVPQSLVALVLPGVEKGKTYTPQDIQAATNMIRQVEKRFPRLYRHTNMLKQDWSTVSKPDTGAESRIDEILSAFASNQRSPAAYKDSCYKLEMIRFRDKQGLLTDKLDAAMDHLRTEFLDAAKRNLAALTTAAPPSLTNYTKACKFADEVLACQLPNEQKTLVRESVRKCHDSTLEILVAPIVKALAAGANVKDYLAARSMLAEFRRLPGGGKEHQKSIAAWETKLSEVTTNALPEYDFSCGGFPLSKEDMLTIDGAGGMAAACATGAVSGMVLDEQCLLIVTQALTGVAAGERIPLPLRMVFSYNQPANRQFALAGVLKTGRESPSPSVWKLPPLAIRDGHAEMKITLTAPSQQPTQAADGQKVFHLFLVYSDQAADTTAPSSWTAASKAYVIPIR